MQQIILSKAKPNYGCIKMQSIFETVIPDDLI